MVHSFPGERHNNLPLHNLFLTFNLDKAAVITEHKQVYKDKLHVIVARGYRFGKSSLDYAGFYGADILKSTLGQGGECCGNLPRDEDGATSNELAVTAHCHCTCFMVIKQLETGHCSTLKTLETS